MLKKKILPILLAAAMITALAACGGSGSNSATAESTAPAEAAAESTSSEAPAETPAEAAGDGVQLDLWHYFTEVESVAMMEEIVKEHEADTGDAVAITYVTREDLLKQYTMGALSGELPDIGMVDNPDHASFAAMGVFQDITALLDATGERDQFFEGPLLSCTYEGKVYGLPNNSNCLSLFINNTMFAEKGLTPPTTWDEMLAVSEQLVDKENGIYPFVMSCMNDEEGTFQFMPWLISAGGSIDDLDSAETVKALDFLKSMIDNGYMSADVINFKQSDANTQFMNGLAAMQLNGPWQVPVIALDAPDLDYSVVFVPKDQKNASVLGGENYAICAGAPLEESFALLYKLTNAESAAAFCAASGKFPPRADAMELNDYWNSDPIIKVFGDQLEYAMPRGPHPRWPEISTAISTALTETLSGVKPAQDALTEAAATYDSIMNG